MRVPMWVRPGTVMAGSRISSKGDVKTFTLATGDGLVQRVAYTKVFALVEAQVFQHVHDALVQLLFGKVWQSTAWRYSKGFGIR